MKTLIVVLGVVGVMLSLQTRAEKPKTDARNFTGVYLPVEDAVSSTAAPTGKRGCVTDLVHIVMGREVLVLVRGKDHQVRRIYINGEHPKDLQPSTYGHSIGRFEDDTLVIETIGLKSGMTLVERLRKVDGGRQLETTVNGAATLAHWRPDLNYLEDICETPAQ